MPPWRKGLPRSESFDSKFRVARKRLTQSLGARRCGYYLFIVGVKERSMKMLAVSVRQDGQGLQNRHGDYVRVVLIKRSPMLTTHSSVVALAIEKQKNQGRQLGSLVVRDGRGGLDTAISCRHRKQTRNGRGVCAIRPLR